MKYVLDKLKRKKEDQTFDRKSARKDPKSLSNHIVAFANADGGTLVIGIEDDGTVTGIDKYQNNVNDILRVPFDFCRPSVRIMTETMECIDCNGEPNHLLIITIPQSTEMHANQHDDVYYRMGDKSQKLNFDERLQLMYAKGSRYFEDEPVADSSIDDIDMDFVAEYCKKIGYKKTPEEYIRQNKDFIVTKSGREEMSGAAILLFGANPQRFFKRARVRFIRYEGTEAKVGTQMNVIKDRIFEGRILEMVEKSIAFVRDQIKEHTRLGEDGRFVTTPEYPEFVWKELIVNAIAHRDYSIKGTDIQIKMFDNRLVVESPGTLPGIVRINNMRQVHFSRNPKIAAFLHEYDYVQEFGEGVDRMFAEMEQVGLPAPEYRDISFMLYATIRNDLLDQRITINNTNETLNSFDETLNSSDETLNSFDETLNSFDETLNSFDETLNSFDETLNETLNSFDETISETINVVDNPVLAENLQKILSYLKKNPTARGLDMMESLHLSRSTLSRSMKLLKQMGLLKRIGSKKTGSWIVKEK